MTVEKLDAAIRAVCPIHGVNSSRVISYMPEATQAQKDAAQAIADAWDFNTQTSEQVAEEAQKTADTEAKIAAKADTVIQFLVSHTPAECADYVQTNVTDLASAKQFLKKVAMALSVLARSELR